MSAGSDAVLHDAFFFCQHTCHARSLHVCEHYGLSMLLPAFFFFIRKRRAAGAAPTSVTDSVSSADAESAAAAVQLEAGLQLLVAPLVLVGAGALSKAARSKLIGAGDTAATAGGSSGGGSGSGAESQTSRRSACNLTDSSGARRERTCKGTCVLRQRCADRCEVDSAVARPNIIH